MTYDAGYSCCAEYRIMQNEIAGLRATILRHGNHASDCMMYRRGNCNCGWPELKKSVEQIGDGK